MPTRADRSPRRRTRTELYELIRDRGGVTRAELIALTGMPRSTVNQTIKQLHADGRIAEFEAEPKGPGSGSGRPAVLLRAVSPGALVAGIDFGHSHVAVALADEVGTLVDSVRVELDVDLDARLAMDTAARLLEDLRTGHDVTDLGAVVAGIPGPIDRHTGVVRSPTILSGWVGLAPADELETRLGLPVRIENDAVLGAYGELRAGAGRAVNDFLYVKASHGIGAAMVVDGKIYRGASGLAGEIGHTPLPGQTDPCRCGNRGCLEAVVSITTVEAQLAHTRRPGADPVPIDLSPTDDLIAGRILETAGRTMGPVLAVLCNLLNPAALIVGGELGAADGPLIAGIDASLRLLAQPATVESLRISAAGLGTDAELVGALHLAADTAAALVD